MWRDSESEYDFLNFTEVADQIPALATNPALLPISVSVFGSWGTGKSTVLQLVERQLPKEGENAPIIVRFDAWMYQGFDDARAALMDVVSRKLLASPKTNKSSSTRRKTLPAGLIIFVASALSPISASAWRWASRPAS